MGTSNSRVPYPCEGSEVIAWHSVVLGLIHVQDTDNLYALST